MRYVVLAIVAALVVIGAWLRYKDPPFYRDGESPWTELPPMPKSY